MKGKAVPYPGPPGAARPWATGPDPRSERPADIALL
jgi:hypothetical protein